MMWEGVTVVRRIVATLDAYPFLLGQPVLLLVDAAASVGGGAATVAVPGFDRKWCPGEDSNLRPAV